MGNQLEASRVLIERVGVTRYRVTVAGEKHYLNTTDAVEVTLHAMTDVGRDRVDWPPQTLQIIMAPRRVRTPIGRWLYRRRVKRPIIVSTDAHV